MSIRHTLALLVAAAVVTGCMNISSTLTVGSDGGGTVTERLTLNPQFAMMMQKMKQMGDSTATSDQLFTEEEVREDADARPGMRLETVEVISGFDGEGYEAVYAFDNVNDINYNPSPDDALPDQAADEGGDGPFELLSAVDVSFNPGSPATLTLHMPRDTTEDDEPEEEDAFSLDGPGNEETSEQEMQMVREMMKDAGINLSVTIDGEIVETNATHRSGATITLVDMDFGTVAGDSTAFYRLMQSEQEFLSPEAAIDSLNALPGITIEPQETVTVRFR